MKIALAQIDTIVRGITGNMGKVLALMLITFTVTALNNCALASTDVILKNRTYVFWNAYVSEDWATFYDVCSKKYLANNMDSGSLGKGEFVEKMRKIIPINEKDKTRHWPIPSDFRKINAEMKILSVEIKNDKGIVTYKITGAGFSEMKDEMKAELVFEEGEWKIDSGF